MAIQVGRTVRTRSVSGGNLFAIAAEEYGDHTLWSVIAQANGLLDPFIVGALDLVIPDKPKPGAQRSGVVGA
ncbi:hypothetical protein ACLBYG_22455 [Methylobacterium sp. D53M]